MEYSLIITYYTHYGVAPDDRVKLIDTSEYVLSDEDLPVLHHEYHTFQGWSHDGVVISSGYTIPCEEGDTNIELVAVWDDTKSYVITEKSEIVAIADAVREKTGSTDTMSIRAIASAITGMVETDPTVPDWAKAENKPTYTADEVGAAPSNHIHTVEEIGAAAIDHTHTAEEIGAAKVEHTQAASTISAGIFAGEVVANSSAQTPTTSLLRNSKLVSTETAPTVNGEICWMYE